MASIIQLVQLVTQGETGKLLARMFNGERGHVYQNEDSELIVVFKSEEETPEAPAILKAITAHYEKMGCRVEPYGGDADCIEAFIFPSTNEEGKIGIVVTTHYPFPAPGQGTAALRLTTNILV